MLVCLSVCLSVWLPRCSVCIHIHNSYNIWVYNLYVQDNWKSLQHYKYNFQHFNINVHTYTYMISRCPSGHPCADASGPRGWNNPSSPCWCTTRWSSTSPWGPTSSARPHSSTSPWVQQTHSFHLNHYHWSCHLFHLCTSGPVYLLADRWMPPFHLCSMPRA